MKNYRNIEHPTFRYDTFDCEIIQIDGLPYVLEKYQDGEIWSDDEVLGTEIIDLTNKRYIGVLVYVDDVKWWQEYIYKYSDRWDNIDEDIDNDAVEYYMNEYKANFKPDKYNSI